MSLTVFFAESVISFMIAIRCNTAELGSLELPFRLSATLSFQHTRHSRRPRTENKEPPSWRRGGQFNLWFRTRPIYGSSHNSSCLLTPSDMRKEHPALRG